MLASCQSGALSDVVRNVEGGGSGYGGRGGSVGGWGRVWMGGRGEGGRVGCGCLKQYRLFVSISSVFS